MMRILVWHWGRRGAGPRFAAELAAALDALPGVAADLSLSAEAELLHSQTPPQCALPYPTYRGAAGFALRLLATGPRARRLAQWLQPRRYHLAICAMPAPLDLTMAAALRRAGIPFAAILHDAETHPGERGFGHAALRRALATRAAAVVALSRHVAEGLVARRLATQANLVLAAHPPFAYGPPPPPPLAHGGKPRLLFFGRLLPYKGLDLLADAIALTGLAAFHLRIAGHGPRSPALARLAALGAEVRNAWVPEDQVGALLAGADALVLSHTEASQSGVAAAALAAGRYVIATSVGGLAEQLAGQQGALLCAPTATALAATLRAFAANPPPPPPPLDAPSAWRHSAARLLADLTPLLLPPAVTTGAGIPAPSKKAAVS